MAGNGVVRIMGSGKSKGFDKDGKTKNNTKMYVASSGNAFLIKFARFKTRNVQ